MALPEGSLVVNSSQGGGSKDTWVLANVEDGPMPTQGPAANGADVALAPAPAAQAPTLGPCRRTTHSSSNSSNDRVARAHTDAGVLSRIAESLYWIGRYVERAEDTARLLECTTTSCWRTGAPTRRACATHCSTRWRRRRAHRHRA